MSWPSMDGSLAGTDKGLRATGDGDAAAAGEAAGEAAGRTTGLTATLGLGEAAGLTAGLAAGAAVGLGAAGAVVGAACWLGAHPRVASTVAVDATPPVMYRTRRTRSRR